MSLSIIDFLTPFFLLYSHIDIATLLSSLIFYSIACSEVYKGTGPYNVVHMLDKCIT